MDGIHLDADGSTAEIPSRNQSRSAAHERINDHAWRTGPNEDFHQADWLLVGMLRLGTARPLRVAENLAAPLPDESLTEHVNLLGGRPPWQRQIAHSGPVAFVPDQKLANR